MIDLMNTTLVQAAMTKVMQDQLGYDESPVEPTQSWLHQIADMLRSKPAAQPSAPSVTPGKTLLNPR